MTSPASRIEYSRGEYWMYGECYTDSVVNVIMVVDRQRYEVLRAYDCQSLYYLDAEKWCNVDDLRIDAKNCFLSFADTSNKGQMMLKHRYLLEDVQMGLGMLNSLGN